MLTRTPLMLPSNNGLPLLLIRPSPAPELEFLEPCVLASYAAHAGRAHPSLSFVSEDYRSYLRRGGRPFRCDQARHHSTPWQELGQRSPKIHIRQGRLQLAPDYRDPMSGSRKSFQRRWWQIVLCWHNQDVPTIAGKRHSQGSRCHELDSWPANSIGFDDHTDRSHAHGFAPIGRSEVRALVLVGPVAMPWEESKRRILIEHLPRGESIWKLRDFCCPGGVNVAVNYPQCGDLVVGDARN